MYSRSLSKLVRTHEDNLNKNPTTFCSECRASFTPNSDGCPVCGGSKVLQVNRASPLEGKPVDAGPNGYIIKRTKEGGVKFISNRDEED